MKLAERCGASLCAKIAYSKFAVLVGDVKTSESKLVRRKSKGQPDVRDSRHLRQCRFELCAVRV
jgi:hypothetical protein